MPRREPRDLLDHERGRPQREQQRTRRRPAGRHRVEREPGGLQRIGEIPCEAAVMLAGHHPVETVLARERGLVAQLFDDLRRG